MKVSIELQKANNSANIYRKNKLSINNHSIDIMQTRAESLLNPYCHYLSDQAKKRLKWMYIIKHECDNNIKKSANKIGVSRQWLSTIHGKLKKLGEDPRSLEPSSKAPKSTDKRKKI